jgi:23S rRNA (adenine2503-C2)-methyltransferase
VDLRGLDYDGLERWLQGAPGMGPTRARSVYQGLWRRRARSVEEIGVNAKLRAWIAAHGSLRELDVARVLDSVDGTRKILWRLADGLVVESVLIPDEGRLTLCVSSQVGCAMGCTFCVTGDLGLLRNLRASEIALQVLQAGRDHADGRRITNLVFMGMGEPLHNLGPLLVALGNCLHGLGLNLSHRKVTVSTVGLVPGMAQLAAALPVNLAISVNATTEEQRRAIMPITKRWSMAEVLDAARAFPLASGKRITFEYVMIGGFNDTLEDAERLYTLLRGIPGKVNLIPYNANPDRDLRRPSDETVRAFQNALHARGMAARVRTTRGIDISAACGQLGRAAMQGAA